MANFLRNLKFDQTSFWLGFVAGGLFWLLMKILGPFLGKVRQSLIAQAEASRGETSLANEIRLGNDTLQLVQGWHLAAPLFSLNEVLIQPRLLAPPIPPETHDVTPILDITEMTIPYLPDWPELGSFYGAPTLSLAEALQGGANIAVIGQPGTGKTVALAHLATRIIQHDPEVGELSNFVPVLMHVADLVLPPRNPGNLLVTISDAISKYTSRRTTSYLPKMLPALFGQKRVLLLIDGLDEITPEQVDEIVEYLKELFKQYPGTRAIVAASPTYLGDLLALDFFAMPVASWSLAQRMAFIKQWSEMWNSYIAPAMPKTTDMTSPLLLGGWLATENAAPLTPLELTLKVWAAFAGDTLGPTPKDTIEAYVRRMLHNQPAKKRTALELLAAKMTLAMKPIAGRAETESWLSGSMPASAAAPAEAAQKAPAKGPSKDQVKVAGAMPDLVASGLVIPHATERDRLVHPVIAGYLASKYLASNGGGALLANQPDWTGKLQALYYLALEDEQASFINDMLDDETVEPLLRHMLLASRWLRNAPDRYAWVSTTMRKLAGCLQKDNLPMGIKTRVLCALALSGNVSLIALFRQMIQSPKDEEMRMMGALGAGMFRDPKIVNDLMKLLDEKSPDVARAAILALVAIGDKVALETVASALVNGDENLRRAAAEGLANHPDEGHPTLEEASSVDDPNIRRAVVFGLARIHQPWTVKILEKLRNEDTQWVVQDVAIQVLTAMERPNPRIPHPLPMLTQTPWLISYAAELGMGVAPGKPAYDLLYRALNDGKEDERLAALYFLSNKGDASSILGLYKTYFSSLGEIRETTLNTLWHLAATGVELPPPAQYGLK